MIQEIKRKFIKDAFELSKHATDQSILHEISVREIREAIDSGEIIEDYPLDKYGPSCLIFGLTSRGRPIHVQCTHPSIPVIKVITLYEPDPEKWIAFKIRGKQNE